MTYSRAAGDSPCPMPSSRPIFEGPSGLEFFVAQVPHTLSRLPLVGRTTDLVALRAALARAREGDPSLVLLTGEGGVGKSRLTALLADEARHAGWTVATGRAYPVEAGVPYAVFADAFVPLLRDLGGSTLTVLARGAEGQLAHLFPALRSIAQVAPGGDAVAPGNRAELFWTFTEFLKNLAARGPLLLVLEDLHSADTSSIELLHFVARQPSEAPILVVGTINETERDAHPTLRATMQSLESIQAVTLRRLEPLTRDGTAELVRHAFGVDEAVTREFSALLYGWTRGNPFFIEETLKALVESGRLHHDAGGWLGWELDRLELPRSVRDAIELRLGQLSDGARDVAELVAVVGTRASWSTMRAVSGMSEEELVEAVEELRLHNLLDEEGSAREPVYDFRHPMLRQTLHAKAGLARRRLLHARIAESLEAEYGEGAIDHADELAHHFMRGDSEEQSERAVKYLAAAGHSALARFANREAADYLEAALERIDPATSGVERRDSVVEDLARARQRLGEFDRAIVLRAELRAAAEQRGDHSAVSRALRRTAVAHFFAGRHQSAIAAYDDALEAAARAGDLVLVAHTRLGRGAVLQAIGRVQDSIEDLRAGLDAAERAHDSPLQARAHRELLLFHTMAGPPDSARNHGARAIALADASGDRAVACTCHWAMSVLEGLTGHATECARHMQRATELAEELDSPLLRLAIDEVHVEWAFGLGAWDTGLALGERAIALARSLRQRQMLPRLLVWTALIHLGRYQVERAKAYLDEAWELSGAGDPDRAHDVHTVVPAHIGRAHYHMTLWQFDEAIAAGRAGLAIVDAAGYQTWAVHRLLPIIAEAQLYEFDSAAARETGARLRREAEAMGNVLGLAWADTCDAILTFREQGSAAAVGPMRAAVEALEAVPYIPSAARLRRQLAGRLADIGDREGAISELRSAHDTFVKLGAQWELEKTRVQFQEVGARPPGRTAGQGADALTERELEIVRLVAASKSNKAIGKALDISPRTVSTHLSNIYGKLEIGTRAELADMAAVILSTGVSPVP